jgi:hypothetical protein
MTVFRPGIARPIKIVMPQIPRLPSQKRQMTASTDRMAALNLNLRSLALKLVPSPHTACRGRETKLPTTFRPSRFLLTRKHQPPDTHLAATLKMIIDRLLPTRPTVEVPLGCRLTAATFCAHPRTLRSQHLLAVPR